MDGNRRWARREGLSGIEGHIAGREATRRLVEAALEFGVQVLSVFAFSTENWKRNAEEVHGLMTLIEMSLREELHDLQRQAIRVVFSGQRRQLPDSLQELLTEAEEATAGNTNMTLNLCVNYGGRAEIADAAARLAEDVLQGRLSPTKVDTGVFADYLYNPQLPDPDLLIRTSGEMRISNFLLYQTAYTEIVVLPTLWPDFDANSLLEALEQYNRRERRYGGRKS
jgi:undecaprenyl diphosphate synthase